ncbi:MAG TPA: hypothetical protein VFA51_01325 [Candidatus Udaeobacter sp.]|nr:hypothetical protein [Candidatus Udaeobacter sp.]
MSATLCIFLSVLTMAGGMKPSRTLPAVTKCIHEQQWFYVSEAEEDEGVDEEEPSGDDNGLDGDGLGDDDGNLGNDDNVDNEGEGDTDTGDVDGGDDNGGDDDGGLVVSVS